MPGKDASSAAETVPILSPRTTQLLTLSYTNSTVSFLSFIALITASGRVVLPFSEIFAELFSGSLLR